MKAVLMGTVAAAALLIAGQAAAADETALATSKGCLACHSIDKKVVGPSYKDVAKKYKGDKGAEAKLVEKVMKGGSGVWGSTPMPANNVTKEEATKLVKWVLSH